MTRMDQPAQQAAAAARQAVQQAREAAQQARQDAQQQAAARIEQGAPVAPPAPPEAPGTFQVQGSDGKVITIGPEGVVVSRPGSTVQSPIPQIPQEAVIISIAFFAMLVLILVGWPISRALARRLDRRGVAPPRVPDEQGEQLRRIEQAVEAMSVEVERISENQRFVTKLLAEAQPEAARLAEGDGGLAARRALDAARPS